MKKILMNRKAGIPIITMIIVAVAIVAIIAVLSISSTPYWETETDFGIWQEELIVEFEDGSTQSLKIIEEEMGKPFTVYYGGKAVLSMSLKLSATASGTGYNSVQCQITNFGYICTIKKGSTTKFTTTQTKSYDYEKDIDESWTVREAYVGIGAEINNNPSKYPDGTYTANFNPTGTFKYRGLPGGDWKTATLPPSRSATLTVTGAPAGQMLITLSSEITTIP